MSRSGSYSVILLAAMLLLVTFGSGRAILPQAPGGAMGPPGRQLVVQGSHPAIRSPSKGPFFAAPGYSNRTTLNWSGYVVTAGTGSATDARGSWIVPSVVCSSSSTYSAFWVGIDGWSDNTVEQIGTGSDCRGGSPSYYAWYEFYPSASEPAGGVTISAGDAISAEVSCVSTGTQCTVSITDITDHLSFSQSQTFAAGGVPQLSSAEWIAEAPYLGSTLPLADFGAAMSGFDATGVASTDFATIGGVSGPIGFWGSAVVEVKMVTSSGAVQAQPSALSKDGASFSVADLFVSGTQVTCGSSLVTLGAHTDCTAVVMGDSPTGEVAWSQTGSGDLLFNSSSCELSSTGECQVEVTGNSVGPVTLNATYEGDTNNPPSSGTFPSVVSSVAVTCNLAAVVGNPATCTASVLGSSAPTGAVSWSADGSGKFSSPACKLHDGACSVKYTPSSTAPNVVLTARYPGDKHNPASYGFSYLQVDPAPSTTKVSCSSKSLTVGESKTIKCTATVTGYKPTGEVSWSWRGTGSVDYTTNTCAIARGRCSVALNGTAAGSVTIQAGYSGDENNANSSNSLALTVRQVKTTLSVSCVSTAENEWICVAALKGYYGEVAGENISWAKVSGSGDVLFPSPSCALSSEGTCSVTVTGTSPGITKVEVVYPGDQNNRASGAFATLKVT